MRARILGGLAISGLLLIAASGPALAQIAETKHNLGTTGTGSNSFDGTGELCVFCHTPHGGDTSANPPLWNRVLPDAGTFTTYDSLGTSSLDGEVLEVGSVSIACLSCHDGTQAMNVMINAPGSGNFDPTGFTLAGCGARLQDAAARLPCPAQGPDSRYSRPPPPWRPPRGFRRRSWWCRRGQSL